MSRSLGGNLSDFQLNWMDESKMQQDAVLLEGDMAESTENSLTSSSSHDKIHTLDTLDEPISETLMRDLRGIGSKMRHIIFPTSSSATYKSVLKDWDLWGPLLLCTFMGLTLHHQGDGQVGPHFAEIFVLIWLGSFVVSINYKLLSFSSTRRRGQQAAARSLMASPSTFQLLCVMGYSLAPPCVGILILKGVETIFALSMKHLLYEKLFVGLLLGFAWPTIAVVKILSKYQEKSKRFIALYPISLFYFVISWFIISAH